jgi:hypothetical protein
MRSLFVFLALAMSLSAFSQSNDLGLDRPVITIGGGAMSTDNTVEALIKVDATVTGGASDEGGYFVLVRMKTDTAISSGKFNYVDIEIQALGGGFQTDPNDQFGAWIEASLFNFSYQRNIAITNQQSYRLSLFAMRIGGHAEITENVKVLLKMGFEIGSTLFDVAKTDNTGISDDSWGSRSADGTQIELSLELFKRMRITVGQKTDSFYALGEEVYSHTECYDTYDEDGWYTGTDCDDIYYTDYDEFWKVKKKYVEVSYKINRRLSLFFEASYNIMYLKDETGFFQDSEVGMWQMLFGISFTF